MDVGLHVQTFLLLLPLSGVMGSPKKGVSVGPRSFLCDDFKALDNMTWWYDWGPNLTEIKSFSHCSSLDNYRDTFVPMIWGRPKDFSSISFYNESQFILGFNEPNHFEQSNLTAADAALLWPEIEKISGGRLLVSPSASRCTSQKCHGDAEDWFDLFFHYCQGCRIDYLATHVYDCEADKTMDVLEGLYQRYGKKIWLTEFACPYTTDLGKQMKYMSEILPKLDSTSYIFRYSWFESRITPTTPGAFITESASLLQENSSRLTELGRYYNSFQASNCGRSFWRVFWTKLIHLPHIFFNLFV